MLSQRPNTQKQFDTVIGVTERAIAERSVHRIPGFVRLGQILFCLREISFFNFVLKVVEPIGIVLETFQFFRFRGRYRKVDPRTGHKLYSRTPNWLLKLIERRFVRVRNHKLNPGILLL